MRYSSTKIRNLLKEGRPAAAARLLGRYWEIEGRVETGAKRGRLLGFPTANLPYKDYLHPRQGVYAVRAGIDRGAETVWHDGVANFGNRPTFDHKDILLEVHLLDYDGDLYGRHLRVALVNYLRPEQKFDGLPALKAQIARRQRRGPRARCWPRRPSSAAQPGALRGGRADLDRCFIAVISISYLQVGCDAVAGENIEARAAPDRHRPMVANPRAQGRRISRPIP